MNIQQMEVFIEISKSGSFTRAGDVLGYSQSRITQMMKQLEDECGFTLFFKDHYGSTLTEAGESLLPIMRQMLRDRDHLYEEISEIGGLHKGNLNVGAYLSCAIHWFPDVMKEYTEAHPNISFNIIEDGWQELVNGLVERELDIAFCSDPLRDDLDFIPVCEDPIVAILPKGHRLAEMDVVPLEEFEHENFIMSSIGYDNDIERVLGSSGVKVDMKIHSRNDFHQINMVKSGLGVGIMPQMILDGYNITGIETRPLDPPQSRILGFSVPSVSAMGPLTREFVRIFQKHNPSRIR